MSERAYELYRVVTDYEALIDAFRERVEDLEVTHTQLDLAAGLQSGYAGKLLAPTPIKRLGMASLEKMLSVTGMAIVLVIDDARFAAVKAQLVKRARPRQLTNVSSTRAPWLITKKNAAKIRALGVKALSPAQRKKIARKAGLASGRSRRMRARKK